MTIEFIPTRPDQARYPALNHLIAEIKNCSVTLGLGDGVLYYGWPKFTDYDAVRHYVDLALVSSRTGVVLIRVLSAATARAVPEATESISQAAASAVSQLIRAQDTLDQWEALEEMGGLSHEDASDLIEELPYKGGDPGNQV
jgi:superfamily I DNA and RNA helicase